MVRCSHCGGEVVWRYDVNQVMGEAYDDVSGVCVRNRYDLVTGTIYRCKLCRKSFLMVEKRERLSVVKGGE